MPDENKSFEYLLVLIENGAVPFCHYDNPHYHSIAPARWMDEKLLGAIVAHAAKKKVSLTFLLGKRRPPAPLERLMDSVGHIKIVPLALAAAYPGAMLVLDSAEADEFAALSDHWGRNLILRLGRGDLAKLSEMFTLLENKFGRLSLHLQDLEHFTEDDLRLYSDELEKVAARAKKLYAADRKIEINVLTDRMMLKAMRNCDAGEKHVTIAPDGRCYVCPAFCADEGPAIGAFDTKKGVIAKVPAGVAFNKAPLCTRCDAWHCKRCVWLSRKLTLEYNVPSWQQCLTAHAEREVSRLAMRLYADLEPFRRMPRIVELHYRDPLELIELPPPEFGVQESSDDPML